MSCPNCGEHEPEACGCTQEQRAEAAELADRKARFIAIVKRRGLFFEHACGGCGVYVGFLYMQERLFFSPGCGCSHRDVLEPRDESELDWFFGPHGWESYIENVLAGG